MSITKYRLKRIEQELKRRKQGNEETLIVQHFIDKGIYNCNGQTYTDEETLFEENPNDGLTVILTIRSKEEAGATPITNL
jgi:hypothetical protein